MINECKVESNVNVNKMCRTCLEYRPSNEMKNIFCNEVPDFLMNEFVSSASIRDVLLSFIQIEIDENDAMPNSICDKCMNSAFQAFFFKKKSEKSDNVLRTTVLKENSFEKWFEVLPSSTTEDDSFQTTTKIPVENNINIAEDTTTIVIEKKYPCVQCNEVFKRKTILNKHIREYHKAFKCEICSVHFSQAQTLGRHMKIHQAEKNKLCTFCGKCFLRSDDLKRHTRIHTGEKPYTCDECPKKYKQSSELKEHQKTHSDVKGYMCSLCGKGLATRNGLYVHMKVHRGEKNHECQICGNKYVTSGELQSHMSHIHSQNKPFKCLYEECGKAFVTKLSLNTHNRSHTGEKIYQCKICFKFLATASSLQEHKRTHTGEKTKECNLCNKKLGNSQALKKHMRIHSGERPFECQICLDKFICGSTLSTHMKIKHLEKQFRCEICDKAFALKTKLKQHMRIHLDEIRFHCSFCNLSYDQSDKLIEHMKIHEVNFVDISSPILIDHPIELIVAPVTNSTEYRIYQQNVQNFNI